MGIGDTQSWSGGEAARLVFSRLSISQPNVLVLDEPTNHLDLESIEALVEALVDYPGTLILVSHDRWFVSQLATRVVEVLPDDIRDYHGTYEEYVHFCGDDHLDADRVILKAKKEKKKKGVEDSPGRGKSRKKPTGEDPAARKKRVEKRQDELMVNIDAAESRLAEIDSTFSEATYYEKASPEDVKALESERAGLKKEVADLMGEWERVGEDS